ncbi:hypothetical protein KAFR_0G01720 [Kazachstania africana CBS 2517]|uniref:Uncharacterized protein n=1 Tax=Kazachstania africana (strain ATCC 22294 / BCRC 22015 / CBS 2517 / CECT 1963 / NBRC 1671 / NRRL Y-8276) TaxID=1071382 RepID=H2AXV6_KAZAF|nr:hypothetical protein KAFR_0G01720 [Kazachstania africana CBS 2517]CCF59206.1 hypothetical protein KAFR_0G01720 [Kazachstania africana CBS 2517]
MQDTYQDDQSVVEDTNFITTSPTLNHLKEYNLLTSAIDKVLSVKLFAMIYLNIITASDLFTSSRLFKNNKPWHWFLHNILTPTDTMFNDVILAKLDDVIIKNPILYKIVSFILRTATNWFLKPVLLVSSPLLYISSYIVSIFLKRAHKGNESNRNPDTSASQNTLNERFDNLVKPSTPSTSATYQVVSVDYKARLNDPVSFKEYQTSSPYDPVISTSNETTINSQDDMYEPNPDTSNSIKSRSSSKNKRSKKKKDKRYSR